MRTRHRINPTKLRQARNLRFNQTPAEYILWQALRNRNIKYKFRRQHPIDPYIVDFYCPEARLCIEVDGGVHNEAAQEEFDATRTAHIQQSGYKVIRFTNKDIRNNIDSVIAEITNEIEKLTSK